MDELLETIRGALAPDADGATKAAGIAACRSILNALEPVAAPQAPPPLPIANLVTALRGVPPDQLLDLAIARLRAALPAGTTIPAVQPMKFHVIPIPPLGGK
jgi:hypothetical protein